VNRLQFFLALLRDQPLLVACAVAVAFRVALFAGSIVWPIPNENLSPVSPLHGQGYFDFGFYLDSLHQYRTLSIQELLGKFIEFYQRPFESQFGHIIAGPVFPALIGIFEYAEGSPLPMAIFYLALDCTWAFAWLWWFNRSGLTVIWMVLFALTPNPAWFMLVISPDLVFAALIGFFYVIYFSDTPTRTATATWVILVLLILLTRPNGYSILLFVLIDISWRHLRERRISAIAVTGIVVTTVLFGLYLYPYFITEMRKSAVDHVFFSYPSSAYFSGLFPALPGWIDHGLSWLALAVARILYFVGLRPSYGATPDMLVLARALPGLVLLPGLLWGLCRAGRRQSLFIALFCLPVLLGPSQDRYNLPVFPLLFFFGTQAYRTGWAHVRRMVEIRAATQNEGRVRNEQ
jgi:hypothetical protein